MTQTAQVDAMQKDTTFSHRSICSLIGLPGVRSVTVTETVEHGRTTYQAVCTAIVDADLGRLIERVEAAFKAGGDPEPSNAAYQAQYAYACGYYD